MASRVVVTGIGAVTSIGTGVRPLWDALLAGRSGISPVGSFDTSRYSVHLGGEVKDFDAGADLAGFGRAAQMAIVAARLALADGQGATNGLDPERAGVVIGTTSGEPHLVEHFNDAHVAGRLSSLGGDLVSRYPCHRLPALVADDAGFEATAVTIPTACAAGNYAVAHAVDVLRDGAADVMLAGGADSFSRITFTGFARLGAIAPDRCRPFDRKRKGTIPGEGAAMLVLEPLERARRRGARIYAEVRGYGFSCDAHHMTGGHPAGHGAARAMELALRSSGLVPADVSYVNAHGTGTVVNDRIETMAIKRALGEHAYRTPVSSIKSMIGHTMGAASAIEAAACALAVHHDRIPPTINLEEPDPDCDLDYVPGRAREQRVAVAVSNANGFGGNNASVVFAKCED